MDASSPTSAHAVDRRWTAWMTAAQAGDDAAFEALLLDCAPFIARVARGQGVRPDSIDDVVQETLLAIHRTRWLYDPSRPFAAWLRTIARRRAIDRARRAFRVGAREVHAPLAYENYIDPNNNPEHAILEQDRIRGINAAIDALPARQREAVEYFARRGQYESQVGGITGGTRASLRVNWHRALKTLRARMGDTD